MSIIETFQLTINHYLPVLPEIWLLSMTCLILIIDVFTPRWSKWVTYNLSQLTLIGVMGLTLFLMGKPVDILFNNMFILDKIGTLLKFIIAFFGFFIFLYSRDYLFNQKTYRSEYFSLCLFSIFGMMVLVSARSFLSLYLGVELVALPLYALIAIVKENVNAPEAAMKYFVMGALASGMLLFGISIIYGVTGTFGLPEIADMISKQSQSPNVALLFGLVFVFAGLAFKFGAVPFHMWIPDVYQGAPITVTLFIGTLSKIAAFGFAIRLLVDTFPTFNLYWEPLLYIMAVLSIAIGNIVAIAQRNIKRMLGYSTIGHMGFLFLGLLAGPSQGYAAALDYMIIYALMALGAFGIITALSYFGYEAERIEDYKGLAQKNRWIAFLMTMIMFSLAGIPPFAGFYAKFFVLNAIISAGHIWLAVFAVLMTVIGAYYYLRIVWVMFFEAPLEPNYYREIAKGKVVALSLNSLAVLYFGVFPTALYNLCVGSSPGI